MKTPKEKGLETPLSVEERVEKLEKRFNGLINTVLSSVQDLQKSIAQMRKDLGR